MPQCTVLAMRLVENLFAFFERKAIMWEFLWAVVARSSKLDSPQPLLDAIAPKTTRLWNARRRAYWRHSKSFLRARGEGRKCVLAIRCWCTLTASSAVLLQFSGGPQTMFCGGIARRADQSDGSGQFLS